MLDNTPTNPIVSSASPPPPTSHKDLDLERAKINQELYERNVELAIRNRTLSALSKMYAIINSTLGVGETAQQLITAIISELNFQDGFIALVDRKEKKLRAIATTNSQNITQAVSMIGKPLRGIYVPLDFLDNYCVSAAVHNQRRMTNSMYDILIPLVDEKTAQKIQDMLNIKTSVIFPLVFGGQVLGVLAIGMDKHVGDLSRAERDTIKELIEVVAIALERAQLYADLKTANEKLKELDKLKDEFVSIASHELRTPMTAIKSYLWMLLHGKTAGNVEKTGEYISRAYDSTQRLINLVNDMLDVSRIEGGRIKLTPIAMDLLKLVDDVYHELLPRSEERKLTLKVEKSELPKVVADPDKIHQVMINLVGNALKFTPEGGSVTIHFDKEGLFVKTFITDTGPGIDKEEQKKLFQKFSKLESSYEAAGPATGTGLGLYICKQIVELLKGKIWVDSDRGKGATFGFTLPAVSSPIPK